MKLLKLLYVADRESVRETGSSITGDWPVAMDWGPVLSTTLRCMNGEVPAAAKWSEAYRNHGKLIIMTHQPGVDKLSRYEVDKLTATSELYGHLTAAQLSRLTHGFEEWLKNQPPEGGRCWIGERDLLDAVGLGDQADRILRECEAYRAFDQLFDSLPG